MGLECVAVGSQGKGLSFPYGALRCLIFTHKAAVAGKGRRAFDGLLFAFCGTWALILATQGEPTSLPPRLVDQTLSPPATWLALTPQYPQQHAPLTLAPRTPPSLDTLAVMRRHVRT